MVVVHVVGLAIGWAVGAVLAVPIFFYSLVRGARAVHAHGVVCRAEVTPLDDTVGARLAGAALVRLSGATNTPGGGPDILGLGIRWLAPGSDDPRRGDQDFLCGTFDSFLRAGRARRDTRADDFLANDYDAVARWWVRGLGVVPLRVVAGEVGAREPGATRRARLEADIAAGRAALTLEVAGSAPRPLARIHLLELLADDGRALRLSMVRTGRGLIPVGLLGGIRALVYPASQLGRRLRGG